jgi:ABC-2 type transport system ATP-binding protein
MIETVDLTRTFGTLVAVEGLNLRIKDGEVFGLLGPNGAGKTTTIRMLTALISSTSGSAYIDHLDTSNPGDQLKIRSMVGLLPESPGLYESLSARQNLDFFGKMYGVPSRDREARIEGLLRTLELWDRRDEAVGGFSKGMKQKIAIARALVHEPRFLFLDEPTSGLDPQAALTVRNYLLELKKEGRTILLNTHNLDDAQRLCDRIGVIRTRLLAEGSPDDLADRFFGRATVVRMSKVPPGIGQAVSALPGVLSAELHDKEMVLRMEDPSAQNPLVVDLIVRLGGGIEYVEQGRRGLEDVYLKIIGGGK